MAPSKVALVTGSGKRRVGWHVAEALAARGYALVIHYRSSAAEATESVAAFRARGSRILVVNPGVPTAKRHPTATAGVGESDRR